MEDDRVDVRDVCQAVIEEGVRLVVVHQQLEAVVHLQANVAKQCELRTYSGRMT